MTVGQLLERLKDIPDDTLVCIAEVDEAFGMHLADVELVRDARIAGREADGREAVEFANGDSTVVVVRW